MIPEMKNYVVVEGLLSSIGLEEKHNEKLGKYITGEIDVRVVQEVEKGKGEMTLEVPVRFFAKEKTNAGNDNPSFISIKTILDSGNSIAAVGEEQADAIRVTGSRLTMQEYYTPDGRFVTFPSIQGSFINYVRPADLTSKAVFECEVVIEHMTLQTDDEGIEVEPKTFLLNGIHVGYGEYANILPFMTRRPDIMTGIENAYVIGDAITLSGKINFTSTVEEYYQEVEIGDPIKKSRTVRLSELLISGVYPRDISSAEYSPADIKKAIDGRVKRLEESKQSAMNRVASTPRTNETQKKKDDLGF